MGRSSDMMNSKFLGESLKDVNFRLNQTIDEISSIKSNEIEPLKKSLLELAKSRGSKTGSLERNITITTERLKSAKTSINASQDSIRNINQRLTSIVQQMNKAGANYTVTVNAAFLGLPMDNNDEGPKRPNGSYSQADLTCTTIDSNTPTATSNYQSLSPSYEQIVSTAMTGELRQALFTTDFQRRNDACVTDLAGVTVLLATAMKTMKNLDVGVDADTESGMDLISRSSASVKNYLKPVNTSITTTASNSSIGSGDSSNSSSSTVPCSVHSAEQCPTCGQALSPDALDRRIAEVASSITSLQRELRTTQDKSNDAKRRLDLSIRAEALRSESNVHVGRQNDCITQIGKNEALIAEISSNERIYQAEILEWIKEKKKIEDEDNLMENQTNALIEIAEKKLQSLNLLEQKLRSDVDEVCTCGSRSIKVSY